MCLIIHIQREGKVRVNPNANLCVKKQKNLHKNIPEKWE